MTQNKLHHKIFKIFALCALVFSVSIIDSYAAVVDRSASRRPSTSVSRMPTMAVRIESDTNNNDTNNNDTKQAAEAYEPETIETSSTKSTTTKESTTTTKSADTAPKEEEEEIDESAYIIEDKTLQFEEVIGDLATANDDSESDLAAQIRAQRAALDAADKMSESSKQIQNAMASGKNACDIGLRKCMQEKCGKDYTKCSGDGDTIWGDKMDSCRRDLPCTGHEYAAFSAEIKADRDMNAKISEYNAIIECGDSYNDCIFTECGKKFEKCLGKKAGDKAIQKCEKIAKNCKKQDSGLPSRMMEAFGAVRQNAEKDIQRDEKKLYELRDAMASVCKRLGAMFDERTLDCVYTVNFYAGDESTLYASKKAYAGSTFDCNQNWFGVDITTFKENAFRATRSAKSASSAFMGAGVGTAAGMISSGMIDRAIDRHKAEKALKEAKEEAGEDDKEGKDAKEDKEAGEDDKEDKDAEEDKEDKEDKKDKKDKKDKEAGKDGKKDKDSKDKDSENEDSKDKDSENKDSENEGSKDKDSENKDSKDNTNTETGAASGGASDGSSGTQSAEK